MAPRHLKVVTSIFEIHFFSSYYDSKTKCSDLVTQMLICSSESKCQILCLATYDIVCFVLHSMAGEWVQCILGAAQNKKHSSSGPIWKIYEHHFIISLVMFIICMLLIFPSEYSKPMVSMDLSNCRSKDIFRKTILYTLQKILNTLL